MLLLPVVLYRWEDFMSYSNYLVDPLSSQFQRGHFLANCFVLKSFVVLLQNYPLILDHFLNQMSF